MTVVLDTNVVFEGRAMGHPYRCILDSCVDGRMYWAVSTPILTEYQEVIRRKEPPSAWLKMVMLMDLIVLTRDTLIHVNPQFQFRVIGADPDDNPFVDCAIAAHADYVITSDRDFAPLANAGYKPQPITPEAFIERYRGVHV
jgi:uncharacterized protein